MKKLSLFAVIGLLFIAGCNYDELKARNSVMEDTSSSEVFAIPYCSNQSDSSGADHGFVARKKDGSVWFYIVEPYSNKVKSFTMIFEPNPTNK